jgi:hypothetical protein
MNRGDLGFGYDPIFVRMGSIRPLGNFPGDVKQKISHREHLRAIPFLRDNIANDDLGVWRLEFDTWNRFLVETNGA